MAYPPKTSRGRDTRVCGGRGGRAGAWAPRFELWPLLQTGQQGEEMGRPPGPHSAWAPAGSTAVPGLIPDLVARIPWLRWALIATAVVAGVLGASCLLCAICCGCGRHRKKPRDEEAVGLGSACSTINTHLVRNGHPAGSVPGGSSRSRLGDELSPQHGLVCPEQRRGGRLAGEAMNEVSEGVGCRSHSRSGGGQRLRGGLGAVTAGPAELSWGVSPFGGLAWRFDPSWTRCLERRGSDGGTVPAAPVASPCDTTQVQPDVDNVEPGPGGPQRWERLQPSAEYDVGSQAIKVGLKQGTADPYARVSLSPEARCRHETKVHRGTLCPTFEETRSFHVPPVELPRTTPRVRCPSQHEPLGVLSLPLGTVDLQPRALELWHPLGPPSVAEPEQLGEVCFSLYVPGSGRLTVVVLEARGLSLVLAEPYVKVQLVLNQRKWKKRKTSTRKGTATPYFNEAFTFLVPFSQIQSVALVLAVWARGPQFRAKPVSKVLLGARASGQPLQHWADMLAHARRPIAQWHRLQPAREVDGALALQPHLRLPLPGS
ncbi:LOW QUALITY PROTEIN: synaptotagmin-8 [Megaptera novaeangliae]